MRAYSTNLTHLLAIALAMLQTGWQSTQEISVETRMVHLRSGPTREWSEFPEKPHGAAFECRFQSSRNEREFTLQWRQQDVKQAWRTMVNGKPLGELARDENDMVIGVPLPAGTLRDGENTLRIETPGRAAADDIRVGEIRIVPRPPGELLNEATVEIAVVDAERREPLPCRITIVDAHGSLQTVGATSNEQLAARPGTIYSATGQARFGVPTGRYTVYAGRGFEYSLAQTDVSVAAGETVRRTLSIRREVPTGGTVACDTHIHTLTHSGHGDATLAERLITLAGEGIELPIATDHNVHVDYEPLAQQMNLRRFFTPVVGNEVTTAIGHFNVFPARPDARVPDHKRPDWGSIFDAIDATPDVKVAILNHARDLHSGTRPFGPKLHNALIGENRLGWPMRFNAMEVLNSSATQSDLLRLLHDWMGLLNRGHMVTPVGSSDSHDVARHFVGQGRTYIRCDDRDPGRIDVGTAIQHFLQGRVLVSYGLIAELTVAGKYQSGDVAAVTGDAIPVAIRVLGPHWVGASEIRLYANGRLIRQEELPSAPVRDLPVGVKWQATWQLPRPKQDVHLVAIAIGPGIAAPYWKTAKPYQPTSPDWEPHTLGCSGAVWLDADGDGRRSSPHDHAARLVAASRQDIAKLLASLRDYDEATAAQAAHLLRTAGVSLTSHEMTAALGAAASHVRMGFDACLASWREGEVAAP
jgi:hypothetical protein